MKIWQAFFAIMVAVLTTQNSFAGTSKPAIGQVRAFVVDEKSGAFVPYTQESTQDSVVLVVKLEGLTSPTTATMTVSGIDDNNAAASEAGQRGSKKKNSAKVAVRLSPGSPFAVVMFPVGCYDKISFTWGKVQTSVTDLLPGSCP